MLLTAACSVYWQWLLHPLITLKASLVQRLHGQRSVGPGTSIHRRKLERDAATKSNFHMGTYMHRSCAHVQVACCCCNRLQLAPMDVGAGFPDLQQLALVVFFIPATSANTLPALVVVTLCNLRW